jgi:phenylpyruvate tautomerase PptA (4-oxalocrotonate tautomerase family)
VPSIQIDLPLVTTAEVKRDLAQQIGAVYAQIMQVGKDLLTVSVHDLGVGGIWRCHESGPPTPSALIMCDIRAGRPADVRAELARALIEVCTKTFDLDGTWVKVEFTQHTGDEMYHPHLGGWNRDWSGDERTA